MVKTSSKLSKILSMLIVVSMVLSSMAFTLPVSADPAIEDGTVLWSENFDGLTEGRDGWDLSIGNTLTSSDTLATYTLGAETNGLTWATAADGSYTSGTDSWINKFSFTGGKAVLTKSRLQQKNTEHVTFTMPVSDVAV
ncbi:MAG: hypothetical protein IJC06_01300, partial [Clostridia bacterium]|nr:hypothetical protein [Clostridia bacterium]